MKASRFLFAVSLLFLLTSCRKNNPAIQEAGLSFSSDTIRFDSLFSGFHSPSQRLIVTNPLKDRILISKIYLENGPSSDFSMIFDGIQSNTIENYELDPGDSVVVFLDYTSQLREVFTRDRLLFSIGQDEQSVDIEAFVMDAIVYDYDTIAIGSSVIWDKSKRYLINGPLLIEDGASLLIQAGTQVYFTPEKDEDFNLISGIRVEGSLRVMGNRVFPVVFQGSRLGADYQETPGQWRGISFGINSKSNRFEHAVIKNGLIGVEVDYNTSSGFFPKVLMEYSMIRNMAAYGIAGVGYSTLGAKPMVDARNCLIHNCQEATFVALGGGNYEFRNCTFANYEVDFNRKSGQLILNNYDSDLAMAFETRARFWNCVVWGTEENEYIPDTVAISGIYDVDFLNCLIRSKNPVPGSGNLVSQDLDYVAFESPTLLDPSDRDYCLRPTSPGINAGLDLSSYYQDDLRLVPRTLPFDIGCYEILN